MVIKNNISNISPVDPPVNLVISISPSAEIVEGDSVTSKAFINTLFTSFIS